MVHPMQTLVLAILVGLSASQSQCPPGLGACKCYPTLNPGLNPILDCSEVRQKHSLSQEFDALPISSQIDTSHPIAIRHYSYRKFCLQNSKENVQSSIAVPN